MKYRREIDGLRALAVIPVIFFHAGFQGFSGGFVGVDVFFVISGYLITSIILYEKEKRSFSLASFYERRARRILPALFLVMLVCIPFAWFWLLPSAFEKFSNSLTAVSFFSSNILFWRESGYFDSAAELKPLLHTWSLAVEEQYYLLFPLFLMIMSRFARRWLMMVLTLIGFASFFLAQWGAAYRPEAAFFLLPTRAWELFIGVGVAMHLYTKNVQATRSERFSWMADCGLAFSGLLMIVHSIVIFDKTTPFPSFYALFPTIGTALVIIYATSKTIVGRVLGWRVFVGVGLVSYSAYLWHQPLFALMRQRKFDPPNAMFLVFLSLLAMLLAYVTWRYVELPFRDRVRVGRGAIVRFGIVGVVLFTSIGVLGHATNGFDSRLKLLVPTHVSAMKTVRNSRCHNQGRRRPKQLENGEFCRLGSTEQPRVAVIGDSHAGAMFESLGEVGIARSLGFYAVSGPFCAPLLNEFRLTRYADLECVATMAAAVAALLRMEEVRDIVLIAEWANYTSGSRDGDQPAVAIDNYGQAESPDQNRQIFERSLIKTVQILNDGGKNVILVEPVPEFSVHVLRYNLQTHLERRRLCRYLVFCTTNKCAVLFGSERRSPWEFFQAT